MDTINSLMHGFSLALTMQNLMWAFIGVTLGTAVGVLPGIGPAVTVALLLPITTKVDPSGALIMFAGIYYGAMYGGSTTSILLNTPGESATIVTAMEGNQMAKRGRAGAALSTSAIGSFVAGTLSVVALTFVSPLVVDIALRFGPPEFFALMVLAFTTVSAVLGSSTLRGLVSLFIGLSIGLVGIDNQSGQARFAFDVPQLLDGIEVVTVAVGLFAVGETLYVASKMHNLPDTLEKMTDSLWMKAEDWKRSWKPWLRGTVIGFPFGAMPAGGAEIPTSSLTPSKRSSRSILTSSARAPSKESPAPRRRTIRRPPAPWSPCSRWACRRLRPQPSCSPRSSNTDSSRGRCCS